MTTPSGPSGPTGPGGPSGPSGPTTHSGHGHVSTSGPEHGGTDYVKEHHAAPSRAASRVSWGGIFCGVFVTIAVGLTLLSLGAGLGLSTVDPATASMSSIGWGTGLWSILTVILATFIGAFAGVKASSLSSNFDAGVQGATIWAVSFLGMTLVAGMIGVAGALAALQVETAVPAADVGEVATWGFFITALLGAVSGVLGGLAAQPTEDRAREERPSRRRVREGEMRPSEA